MLNSLKMKIVFLFFIIIFILYFSFFIVQEKDVAIVTQFGRVVKTIKDPGLYFKYPFFIQKVNYFDKRMRLFTNVPIQLLLGDKNPLIIVSYFVWQIDNPVQYFQSITTEDDSLQKLSEMITSLLGSELGDYKIENIINVDKDLIKIQDIEDAVIVASNRKIQNEYGVKIIDFGIRRINYPSIVETSVYNRMQSERQKEANRYRAEGRKEAALIRAETDRTVSEMLAESNKKSEIIMGEGDRTAMENYAEAYGKNQDFFEYLKSLELYKEILGNKSTVIFSTESDLFKYFHGNQNE
jgi:modulator of FtsH protease HflC